MAEHEEETVAESSLMETIKEKLPRADCSSSSDSDDEKSSEPSAADAVKANIYHLFGREKAVHQVLGGGKRTETIKEKFSRADFSSSSDSDDEKSSEPSPADAVKAKIYHLFGREKAVHQVLGGGKPADVFLWRNKKVSAVTLGGATAIWILFELMEYHLLTLACHGVILYVAIRYLWSKATTFVNKSPPQIPKVIIPEDLAVNIALSLRYEMNRGFAALGDIASGRHLKKFLAVIAGLWLLSIIGNCCNFLTLFYIAFVTLHTVPVLYEKYEDEVDAFAEKAQVEFKKHYAVIHAKYLSKIPKGPLKDKTF